jgi:cation:H+ antiporter
MRSFDLAIGNIFGSNVFNLVTLVPVDCFQPGPLFGTLSSAHAVTAAWIMLVTAVAAMGQLYRAEKRYWLFEPDASLIIVLVLIALVMVFLWR